MIAGDVDFQELKELQRAIDHLGAAVNLLMECDEIKLRDEVRKVRKAAKSRYDILNRSYDKRQRTTPK